MPNPDMIYLDNAATSFPKPKTVVWAVEKALREGCGNPTRSSHRLALSAGRVIDETRILCARLFNAPSPNHIIFTNNATTALNIAIKGVVLSGDHILTSSLEHNSVVRPVKYLETNGVQVTKIPTCLQNGLTLPQIEKAIQKNTKLLVCTHVSNVTGTVNDITTIGNFCREKGIIFLVDAAQSAGMRPIDIQEMNIDLLAFPGHKGLLGPQGTGGLIINPGLELDTLIQGGTGSMSESLEQPHLLPERFESGTPNVPGLAGLAAGIQYILDTGLTTIADGEKKLIHQLIRGLSELQRVHLIGPDLTADRGNVVSVTLDNITVADAALMMDAGFNIAVRSGLHCSVDAHHTTGTLSSGGTLRISPGHFNCEQDIEQCLTALSICAKGL